MAAINTTMDGVHFPPMIAACTIPILRAIFILIQKTNAKIIKY